jgi:hypothetical protein
LKSFYKITAAIFLATFLFSCNCKQIEVKLIGEIRTRRTFADIQSIDNEKERSQYIAQQEKSNPWLYDSSLDSILIRQFERLGLIKNNELLEKEFKPETKQKTNFIDRVNRSFPVEFFNDSLTGYTHFKIFFSGDSVDIDTNATSLQNLDYAFLDVIPGGNKELVFLDDYYIMNGFNFDLKVYAIKTNLGVLK